MHLAHVSFLETRVCFLAVTSSRFIEVDVDALQLQVGITMIGSGGVDSVLVRKDLPEEEQDIYQPEEWELWTGQSLNGYGGAAKIKKIVSTHQNLDPIWLPHWPPWMWTISLRGNHLSN